MNDSDFYQCLSTAHNRRDPGKVILYHTVFLIPGRLIKNRSRIIPFSLSFHGSPGQMGRPQSNSKGGLPVSLKLMSPEIVIPVCDPIQLACHSFSVKLMNCALGLFCSGKLPTVTQNINPRNLESCIGKHGLSHIPGLRRQ